MSARTIEILQQAVTPRPEVAAAAGSLAVDGVIMDLTERPYQANLAPEDIAGVENHLQTVMMSAGYGALVQSELTAVSGIACHTPPVDKLDEQLRESIQLSFGRLKAGEPVVQTDLILNGLVRIIKNPDLPPVDHVKAAEFYIRTVRYSGHTDNSEKYYALMNVLDKLPQLVR